MTQTTRDALTRVNPPELGRPSGFTHGVMMPPGAQVLFVAGQTATDPDGAIRDPSFAGQFDTALRRVLAVVAAAGGQPEHIGRMTVFVTDLDAYREARPALRDVWVRHLGSHYPAMTLVEVSRLVDAGAQLEIEATAVLPGTRT